MEKEHPQNEERTLKWLKREKDNKKRDTCFKCSKKGYKVIECGKFQYYNCGKQGHLARDCKVRLRFN